METPIAFHCASCGIRLEVPPVFAGVTAPCPSCGQPTRAPAAVPVPEGVLVKAAAPAVVAKEVVKRRSGRISAETGLDFEDVERREAVKTLRVIAWIVAAVCACLAIAWYVGQGG